MNVLVVVLGLLGAAPAVGWLLVHGYWHVIGRLTWNHTFRLLDRTLKRISDEHPDFKPDAIVSIGFGGYVLTPYISQFFGSAQHCHVDVRVDAQAGTREINRESLTFLNGSRFLIVSGITESGFALSTVKDAIGENQSDATILSYSFCLLPQGKVSDEDAPLARPDYFSLRRRRFRLPWYRKRYPSIVPLRGGASAPMTLLPTASIRNISLDVSALPAPLLLTSDTLLAALTDTIKELSEPLPTMNVVIAGPAAIGKSMLAQTLRDGLDQVATYLPLDSCVRETADRDQDRINGCQPEAYDWSKISSWIDQLDKKASFEVSPYDHATRQCQGTLVVDGSRRIRIMEWVFALAKECPVKGDLRIVLLAAEAARSEYWRDRFKNVRRTPLNDSAERAISDRLAATKAHIIRTLRNWDIRFQLDADWSISRIDSKIAEFNVRLASVSQAVCQEERLRE